jgi:hypothetical protein
MFTPNFRILLPQVRPGEFENTNRAHPKNAFEVSGPKALKSPNTFSVLCVI